MNNNKKILILDSIFYVFYNIFFIVLLYQLHLSNYRYMLINDFDIRNAIIIYFILLIINVLIYIKLKNTILCRINFYLQFYLLFIFAVTTTSSIPVLYAPVIVLLIASFYIEKKLYYIHLVSYLGIICGNIIFVIISLFHNTTAENKISQSYIIHLFISLFFALSITFINFMRLGIKINYHKFLPKNNEFKHNHLNKNDKFIYQINSKDYLNVLSVSAVENDYEESLTTLIHTMDELTSNASFITSSVNSLKNNMMIASSNSKSVSSLSSKLQKDINDISVLTKQLDNSSMKIKNSIVAISDLFNTMLRTNLNINSSHTNILNGLEDINSNRKLLENILIELENLSIVTTHLSNKTTIEASNNTNQDVLNLIVEEFYNYSNEIRSKILKMSYIFENLNKNYYSCKKDITTSDNLIASNSLIISSLYQSLDTINSSFNDILSNTTQLDALTELAHNKSKSLTADSVELCNALNEFGKISFSLSKLNKHNSLTNAKIKYLKY